MKHTRTVSLRLAAVVALFAIIAAACGSSKNNAGTSTTAGAGGGSTTTVEVPQGGTLTVGAEQEPDCFDWIGSCGGSSWGFWMAQIQTMPAAFVPTPQPDGSLQNVPGPVLAGAPTFAASPVETITYNINPAAVWSDGVAITCDDFVYTADQVKNGSDILDRTGYTDIDKVSCPDPKTAVVTYAAGKTYAGWESLFAGGGGILPSHILKGKDRTAAMKNGYTWSGGPWIAKWTKGDNITLTPNASYWGTKPKLDKVVFKLQADTAAEFQAFKSGQVQAIYPQPQIDVIDAIGAGLANAKTVANPKTAYVEALWFQHRKPPLDSKAVRQAIAYAIDRDAIVKQLFGKVGVDKAVNSINPYAIAAYSNPDATAMYKQDLSKVDSLMTGDGWAKGADGIWAKGGQKASFELKTTQGNKRRELTATALQQELKDAGFQLKLTFRTAADLFGVDTPKGNFEMALFASGITSLTPGLCTQFCTSSIPSAANNNSGQNYYRYSNAQVDPLLAKVDSSLDEQTRKDAAKQADDLMAADVAAIPLDPLPDILIWSDKVVGPVTDNSILGMFWNINEWGCQGGSCT